MKQLGLDGRHRDNGGAINHKRGDTLTLGLGAFKKVSAVEGIKVSPGLAKDLSTLGKKYPGEAERTRYISGKYGKK